MVMWRTLGLTVACLGLFLGPAATWGQTRAMGGPGGAGGILAGAMEEWSPLALPADLPRVFPSRLLPLPGLLEASAPRVGLFWSGGNPAAIPFEMAGNRSAFGGSWGGTSGDYRRPFDPGSESRVRAAASGFQPLGSRGGGVASALLEDASFQGGVFSNVLRPYTSSPYVVADTSGTDLDQLGARLEAAGGWRFGPYAFGLGVGFQGEETRTVGSPVPRRAHSAGPGVSGGALRELSGGALRLGVFGRWRSLNETVQAYTVAAPTQIYQINGYADPQPASVYGLYLRWFEEKAWSVGGGISGTSRGADWAIWGHRARVDQRQSNERVQNPRTDAWRAWSTTAGAAVQRRVLGSALLTATAQWTGLNGEAEPAPKVDPEDDPLLDPVVFRVAEDAVDATFDLRTPLGEGRWEVAAILALRQEWRDRTDTRNQARSDLDMRMVGASFEILRRVGRDLAVSAGGGIASYTPVGGVPDPGSLGPVYARWIAPELALLGTAATGLEGAVGARWRAGPGRTFWARLSTASLDPGNPVSTLPFLPQGQRRSWNLSLGIVLGS